MILNVVFLIYQIKELKVLVLEVTKQIKISYISKTLHFHLFFCI